jgi:hypothetical protein
MPTSRVCRCRTEPSTRMSFILPRGIPALKEPRIEDRFRLAWMTRQIEGRQAKMANEKRRLDSFSRTAMDGATLRSRGHCR